MLDESRNAVMDCSDGVLICVIDGNWKLSLTTVTLMTILHGRCSRRRPTGFEWKTAVIIVKMFASNRLSLSVKAIAIVRLVVSNFT